MKKHLVASYASLFLLTVFVGCNQYHKPPKLAFSEAECRNASQLPALMEIVEEEESGWYARSDDLWTVLDCMKRIGGPKAAKTLSEWIQRKELAYYREDVRRTVLSALIDLDDRSADAVLIGLLDHENDGYREMALSGLFKRNYHAMFSLLRSRFEDREKAERLSNVNFEVLEQLVQYLRDRSGAPALEMLKQMTLLSFSGWPVPLKAIIEQDITVAVSTLEQLTTCPYRREGAVVKLVELTGMKQKDRLVSLLKDGDPKLRATAADQLAKLKTGCQPLERVAAYDNDYYVRRRALYALGEVCEGSAPKVLEQVLLQGCGYHLPYDHERQMKTAAATSMGEIADPATAPVLEEALYRYQPYEHRYERRWDARYHMIAALGKIGGQEGFRALSRIYYRVNTDHRISVVHALQSTGEQAMPFLEARLKDETTPEVLKALEAAVKALRA